MRWHSLYSHLLLFYVKCLKDNNNNNNNSSTWLTFASAASDFRALHWLCHPRHPQSQIGSEYRFKKIRDEGLWIRTCVGTDSKIDCRINPSFKDSIWWENRISPIMGSCVLAMWANSRRYSCRAQQNKLRRYQMQYSVLPKITASQKPA